MFAKITESLKGLISAKMLSRCGFCLKKTYQGSPFLVALVSALTALAALEPIATLWVGKLLIDSIIAYLAASMQPGFDKTGPLLHETGFYIGLECLIALSATALAQFNGYLSTVMSQKVGFLMQQEMYEHCLSLDYSFFESPQSQDMLVRSQNGSGQVLNIFNSVLRLASMVVTMVSSLVLLFGFNLYLGLLAFVTALPNFILNARLTKERYDVFFKRTERTRQGMIYGWFLTHPMFAKDTILLGIGKYFYNKWKDTQAKTLHEDIRLNAKQSWIQISMQWLNRIVAAGSYAAVVILSAGKGSAGSVAMNIGLFRQAQGQVQGLSDILVGLNNSIVFLEDYFQLMGIKSKLWEGPNNLLNGEGIRSIEFKNVSFSYPGAERKALDSVSFRLESGQSLFLAGRNGAGKTSLIKLMLRLYEPTEGTILLNERPIQEFSPDSVRRAFSVLMQDYAKYPFTARENIQVGDINNAHDEQRLEHAIEASRFREILEKLPEGLETYLMRFFGGPKQGHDLSGGEWQKLALARSFFRHSSVFILDEPTSNLDVQSESEVLGFFKQHVEDKIAIIVSHRLSAAAVADQVVFVEGGKIVEAGNHDDLIQGTGPYASLFKLQQSGFSFL